MNQLTTRLRLLVLLAAFVSGQTASAQTVSQTIDPLQCHLFSAAGAGADRNSDTSGQMGKPIDIGKMNKIAVAVSWASLTGSVDATVKLQVAVTPAPPVTADWVDKTSATFTLSGTDGLQIISVTNLTERWARVVYTHNSVTGGAVSGYCQAKSI